MYDSQLAYSITIYILQMKQWNTENDFVFHNKPVKNDNETNFSLNIMIKVCAYIQLNQVDTRVSQPNQSKISI